LTIDVSNAQLIAQKALSSSEFALMLIDEASFVLQKLDGTSLYRHPWNCENGEVTYSLTDADQDGKLSIGDTASADYQECQTAATDGILRGHLSIAVSDVDDFRGTDTVRYAGTVTADALTVAYPGSYKALYGNLDFEFNRGIYESSIAAHGTFTYRPLVQGGTTTDWQGLDILKTELYETATYTLDISGAIELEGYVGNASVASTAQLGGYLNTFPSTGTLAVTANDGSALRVTPGVAQLDATQISVDESGDGNFADLPGVIPWNDLNRGYLWWYELGSPRNYNIKTFDLNDFSILNRRPFFRANRGSEIVGVNPEIRIQASRAVDPASAPANAQMRLISFEWPFTPLVADLDVEVRGAMVFFRPLSQLTPGSAYAFPNGTIWFSDFNGNIDAISEFDGAIGVSEPIVSIASPEEIYGFPGDQILLDAGLSTSEGSQAISYSWEQVLGPAAAIAGANEQQATITLPSVTSPDLIRVHLKSTNEMGEYDYAKTDISVFSDPSSMDVVVTRGNSVDGPDTETLYTPANGTQTYFYNGQDYLSVENETIYVVATSGSANVAFRLDLNVVFGFPSDGPIAAGVYDVPENSSLDTPRLRVRGNEQCNGGPGRFEILEYQVGPMNEVEQLAVDYSLQCSPGYGFNEVSGHVRYKSSLPIPAAP
jgi:hypothetical protein